MYVEVDFGRLQSASSVIVETSNDSPSAGLKLEGMGADGAWTVLADHPVPSRQPIRTSLRLAATAELKARGVNYLLIKPDNYGADDLRRYPGFWGLSLAGSVGDVRVLTIRRVSWLVTGANGENVIDARGDT